MKDNNTKVVTSHLKNIWFASPNQLFFWTKKPSKFGSENWKIPILQLLKNSELCKGKNSNKHLPLVQEDNPLTNDTLLIRVINFHLFLSLPGVVK